MTVALVVLFVGLVVATFGTDLLQRYAADVVGNHWAALGLTSAVSGVVLLVFLQSAYFRLTNARMTHREVLPGAVLVTVALVVTLQALPLFVWVSSGILALQALGATFLLLVWLYVMANMIVFGAVFNYELAYGATRASERATPEPSPDASSASAGRSRSRAARRATPPAPGASARASRRRRARRRSASRPSGRRSGRSRSPRPPPPRGRSSLEHALGDDLAPAGAIATITQT